MSRRVLPTHEGLPRFRLRRGRPRPRVGSLDARCGASGGACAASISWCEERLGAALIFEKARSGWEPRSKALALALREEHFGGEN